MRVAVVGGRLQGLEATYLALKAGWEVLLIDKERDVPAAGLSHYFCQLDVTDDSQLLLALNGSDLVIPALENIQALDCLKRCADMLEIPILYDEVSYYISSSKERSNTFFSRLGVPIPSAWPACQFPILVKPSQASGSKGVSKITNEEEFEEFRPERRTSDWIIQQYLEGPSYSLEVIGFAGVYKLLQITEIQVDEQYDCKRVLAPVLLEPAVRKELEEITLKLARSLGLQGIMDVEVIRHQGKLRVLEIDARLPSQTPTVVFKSTGINMLQVLGEALTGRPWSDFFVRETRGVVFEHIRVTSSCLEVCGEGIMSSGGTLHLEKQFFGADEAITDYVPGKSVWRATLIITGPNRKDAWVNRCAIIRRIGKEMDIKKFADFSA